MTVFDTHAPYTLHYVCNNCLTDVGYMPFGGDLTPAMSEGFDSGPHQPTSSVSASHTSPSIPAEGDWLEASDLDGGRWVRAEDMEAMWGQDAPLALVSNASSLALHPPLTAAPTAPLSSGAADEPSPKRLRLSTSPIRTKGSELPVAAHHAMISTSQPVDTMASSQPASKDDTQFTDPNAESEDDTGSSGDISASLRPMHPDRQQAASSPHSAGSVSDGDEADDPDFDEAAQASSQGVESDNESESSDGFEGVPSRYCLNCMSRMYLGEVLCLVRTLLTFAYRARHSLSCHALRWLT